MTDTNHSQLVEGVDFYWDGGYMVFTEEYHLKRGYCCSSGCRHCPYKNATKKRNHRVPTFH